ncbi:MAG: ABC transporter permease, partial [Bacteroidia bacterium]
MNFGKLLLESFTLTINFLKANKLRGALSVLGISIGIFCIVATYTASHSLEKNLRANIDKMGDNIVYVQKMPWNFGGRTPWWEYQSRPQATLKEYRRIKKEGNSNIIKSLAYFYEFGSNTLKSEIEEISGVRATAITGDFFDITQWKIEYGRSFSNFEIEKGGNAVILGYNVAKNLFAGSNPIGKSIKMNGHTLDIIGVLEFQGNNMGGSQYDDIAVLTSVYANKFANPKANRNIGTSIVLKGYPGTDIKYLDFEIKRLMRSIRKLRPKEKDN